MCSCEEHSFSHAHLFVGHGSQFYEADGFNEVLLPGDYRDSGPVFDDEIYHLFVTQVQAGVHVVAVIDCCNPGKAMALPYVCHAGEEEIYQDDTFRMPVDGSGGIKERISKERKKKKKKKDKGKGKDKDDDKDSNKKKKKKKKPKETEESMEAYDDGKKHRQKDDEDEEDRPKNKGKKKIKGFFGFGKKKK